MPFESNIQLGGGGGGDGLSQAQVDARVEAGVEDWAEQGNTDPIPADKLSNAPSPETDFSHTIRVVRKEGTTIGDKNFYVENLNEVVQTDEYYIVNPDTALLGDIADAEASKFVIKDADGNFTYTTPRNGMIAEVFHDRQVDITDADGYVSSADEHRVVARLIYEGGIWTISNSYYKNANYPTESGAFANAEGYGTTASGYGAHAEGLATTASGTYSHAEGVFTTASGTYSHAEGDNTVASGTYTHAEGASSTASGEASHAEGGATTASGNYSHAQNLRTTANKESTTSMGKNGVVGHPDTLVGIAHGETAPTSAQRAASADTNLVAKILRDGSVISRQGFFTEDESGNRTQIGAISAANLGDLADVPDERGTAGQVLKVNSAGSALEYADESASASDDSGYMTGNFDEHDTSTAVTAASGDTRARVVLGIDFASLPSVAQMSGATRTSNTITLPAGLYGIEADGEVQNTSTGSQVNYQRQYARLQVQIGSNWLAGSSSPMRTYDSDTNTQYANLDMTHVSLAKFIKLDAPATIQFRAESFIGADATGSLYSAKLLGGSFRIMRFGGSTSIETSQQQSDSVVVEDQAVSFADEAMAVDDTAAIVDDYTPGAGADSVRLVVRGQAPSSGGTYLEVEFTTDGSVWKPLRTRGGVPAVFATGAFTISQNGQVVASYSASTLDLSDNYYEEIIYFPVEGHTNSDGEVQLRFKAINATNTNNLTAELSSVIEQAGDLTTPYDCLQQEVVIPNDNYSAFASSSTTLIALTRQIHKSEIIDIRIGTAPNQVGNREVVFSRAEMDEIGTKQVGDFSGADFNPPVVNGTVIGGKTKAGWVSEALRLDASNLPATAIESAKSAGVPTATYFLIADADGHITHIAASGVYVQHRIRYVVITTRRK